MNISLQMDLFTGLAILVSAIGIMINQRYDQRVRRQLARTQALDSAVQSLLDALEQGIELRERISWAVAEGSNIPSKDIVNFAFMLRNRIEMLECRAFSIWATDEEQKKLQELREYSEEWARQFARANGKREGPPEGYSLDDLLQSIKTRSCEFSAGIRP